MMDIKITVLTHLYYSFFKEISALNNKKYLDINYLFNINKDNLSEFKLDYYKNSTIISSPNKGKDIGGKLALIDLALKLNLQSDYYIFLHDKKSPHTTLGETWKKKLLRIIEQEYIIQIAEIFEKEKTTGIICSKEFITNEYDSSKDEFTCTSNMHLKELLQKYQLKPKSFDFVGGTMFWIRADIINSFFKKHNPLEIRATLEEGNVLDHEKGSITHSWERMLSWIASDQGYTIKGI